MKGVPKKGMLSYANFIKPLLDFIIAVIAFIVLLPVFIVFVILLSFTNNGKPFFLQLRPGKNEKIFRLIKFKTMNDKKDKNGKLLPDAQRLSQIGKFVRKTSLDEIPQLLNVIIGDMSLIGPRPLLVEYLPLYNSEQRKRHIIKPGITGWAQVNGRNSIKWEKKFEYDSWYIDNISFALDFKILIMTVKKVFKTDSINADAGITMEAFNGNE